MIWLKIAIFFVSLGVTFGFIEDVIERIIGHLKQDKDEYHMNYTTGHLITFDFRSGFLTIILWTGFYLINQL